MICPICKKKFVGDLKSPTYPFCGNLCKNVDLYNWLNGDYFICESIEKLEGYTSGMKSEDDDEDIQN